MEENNCIKNNSNELDAVDRLFFAIVLETTLLQMMLLDGCDKLRQYEEQLNLKNASIDLVQWNKHLQDRYLVKEVCRRTLLEIVSRGQWQTLSHIIDTLSAKFNRQTTLNIQHSDLIRTREEVSRQLSKLRAEHRKYMQSSHQKIACIRDAFEDSIVNSRTRLIYTEKWLDARHEALQLSEPVKRPPIPRIDHETRVHEELNKAYVVQTKELENQVEYWRLKYADDTANINKSIAEERDRLQSITARRKELQQLFNLHDGEIKSWLAFKNARAERLAIENKLKLAAIRIQAWWRGVMVRRGLGCYRHLRNLKKSPEKKKKRN